MAKKIKEFKRNDSNSKTISSEYGFYINEERVQIIERENYTTYTFIVERDSLQEGILENYMYKEFEDETYKQFLLKYYYTLNDVGERIYSTTVMDIEEIIDESLLINKNPTSGDCFPHFVESYLGFICTTSERCSGPNAGAHEVGNADCPCQVTVFTCVRAGVQICQHTYGYTFDDCSGGGTGNNDVNNPNDPNNPPTGGGGGNPDPNPDPDETDAFPFEENIDYVEEIITCANGIQNLGGNNNNQLTQDQIDWLNNATLREIRPLYEYLTENSCSEEAQESAIEIIELYIEIDELEETIIEPGFDPLNDNWINDLRIIIETIEDLRVFLPEYIFELKMLQLNAAFIIALNKTALEFNPNVASLTEAQKLDHFENDGTKGIGILLFEFANGLGPDFREFDETTDFWLQYFAGDRINQIKSNFEDVLVARQLTFNQFVANGNMVSGENAFSPDHTDVITSFNQHVNANWVQFFIGGTSIEYRPTNQAGYIDVIVSNPTSRNSLMFHLADDYDRPTYGNIPLSTIEQVFRIRIQVR